MAKTKIKIIPFIGYGHNSKFYCRGRIIEDENIKISQKDSILNTLLNSYKRVESDEIPHQAFKVKFGEYEQEFKTNSEGYYLIIGSLKDFTSTKLFEKFEVRIDKENYKEEWSKVAISKKGKILFPSKKAKFGIISDIDDTILKTDVLSTLKWKIFYNTLFIKASNRMPIKHANLWYQKLRGKDKLSQNPFFYVSNSPWNLYEYLQDFLKLNKFPEGVVLLRDFGRNKKDKLQAYKKHKFYEVENILKMYPKLEFLLIGDGGEKDANIYLKMKKMYPKQVKAIFIHRLGDKKHQSIIEKLSKGHEAYFFFVKNADEGIDICEKLGLL
ncbi:MAG: phosphatidate phosphatase APP1 [Planctomycetota bacterium]|jgi:phosphatidate phosphatase APP1